MNSTLRTLGSLVALSLAVVVGGCADAASPLAPRPEQPAFSTSTSSNPDMARLARFRQKPQVTIAWAKKWIGPEGGRVDFMGFAIDVPAGAVDKVTMFTIRLPVDPQGSEHVVAEFGPHGAKFAKPLGIEFPFRGTSIEDASAPTVVWWNDGWVNMGGAVTADGLRLRTTTDHFSTFGTAEDTRSGAIVASGG